MSQIDLLLNELDDLVKECSKPDWDGYCADPISMESYKYAKQFINELPLEKVDEFTCDVGCEPSGNIIFDWLDPFIGELLFSVQIDDSGKMYFVSFNFPEYNCVVEWDDRSTIMKRVYVNALQRIINHDFNG